MNTANKMFYRVEGNGNAEIFHDSGERVTVIDANVYPVGSDISARYEHSDGIVLSVSDAQQIGISAE